MINIIAISVLSVAVTVFTCYKAFKNPFAKEKYSTLRKMAKNIDNKKKELLKQYLSLELLLSFNLLILLQIIIWYFLWNVGIYLTIDFKIIVTNAITLVTFNNAFNNAIVNLTDSLQLPFLEYLLFPLDNIWEIKTTHDILRK